MQTAFMFKVKHVHESLQDLELRWVTQKKQKQTHAKEVDSHNSCSFTRCIKLVKLFKCH